jgi:hypothetical protein
MLTIKYFFFQKLRRSFCCSLVFFFFIIFSSNTLCQPAMYRNDEAALLQTLQHQYNNGFRSIDIDQLYEKHGNVLNSIRIINNFLTKKFLKYKPGAFPDFFSRYFSPILKQSINSKMPADFWDSLYNSKRPGSIALYLILKNAINDTAAISLYAKNKINGFSGDEEKSFLGRSGGQLEQLFPAAVKKNFDYADMYLDNDAVAMFSNPNMDDVVLSPEIMGLMKYVLIFKRISNEKDLRETFNKDKDLLWQAMVADAAVSKGLSFAGMLADIMHSRLAIQLKLQVLLHQLKKYPSAIPHNYPYSTPVNTKNVQSGLNSEENYEIYNTLTEYFLTNRNQFNDSIVNALQTKNIYDWQLFIKGVENNYPLQQAFLQRHLDLLANLTTLQSYRIDSITNTITPAGYLSVYFAPGVMGGAWQKNNSIFEKLFTVPEYFDAVKKAVLNNTAGADSLKKYPLPACISMIKTGNYLQAGYAWYFLLHQKPGRLKIGIAELSERKYLHRLFFMAKLLRVKDTKKQLVNLFSNDLLTATSNQSKNDDYYRESFLTQDELMYFKGRETKLFRQAVMSKITDTSESANVGMIFLNAYPEYFCNEDILSTDLRRWYLRHFAGSSFSPLFSILTKKDEEYMIDYLYSILPENLEVLRQINDY